jgi:hypothetical protein
MFCMLSGSVLLVSVLALATCDGSVASQVARRDCLRDDPMLELILIDPSGPVSFAIAIDAAGGCDVGVRTGMTEQWRRIRLPADALATLDSYGVSARPSVVRAVGPSIPEGSRYLCIFYGPAGVSQYIINDPWFIIDDADAQIDLAVIDLWVLILRLVGDGTTFDRSLGMMTALRERATRMP